jgi:hypothetical protein
LHVTTTTTTTTTTTRATPTAQSKQKLLPWDSPLLQCKTEKQNKRFCLAKIQNQNLFHSFISFCLSNNTHTYNIDLYNSSIFL